MRCLQNKEDEWKWNPMFSTGLVSLIHFSRGPAPCQDHTSKGTGEVCSQAPVQMSCISCAALCAASSELVKLGSGPRRNAVQFTIRTLPGTLGQSLWKHGQRGAGPTCSVEAERWPTAAWVGHMCLMLCRVIDHHPSHTHTPPMINHDSMALCLKQAEFLYVFLGFPLEGKSSI